MITQYSLTPLDKYNSFFMLLSIFIELGLTISHMKSGIHTILFPTSSNLLSHTTNKSGTIGFFKSAIFIGSIGLFKHKSVLSEKPYSFFLSNNYRKY